jgi:UDP-N-acetylglucosamine acyltransferase
MTSLHATALVDKDAQLGDGVHIGPYCVIGPHVRIGAGTRLMSHIVVDGRTTIGAGCTLFPFACVGTQTQDLKFQGATTYVEIGDRTTLREYVTVNSGTSEGEITRVGSGCHIMAYCHVAHACRVGNGVIMSNGATLAGEVTVEDHAVVGGLTAVHQFCRVGTMSMVGGCSGLTQDVPPYMMAAGRPAEAVGINAVLLRRKEMTSELRSAIKEMYRILYRRGLNTTQAIEQIEKEIPRCPEVEYLVRFIRESKRGIIGGSAQGEA